MHLNRIKVLTIETTSKISVSHFLEMHFLKCGIPLYYNKKIEENTGDLKATWKILNKFINKDKKQLKLMKTMLTVKSLLYIEKYTDLGVEIKKLWNMQTVNIIPIVIGCTGLVDNSFVRYLGKIPAEINVLELQKIVLLNMCYIVRRFLSMD